MIWFEIFVSGRNLYTVKGTQGKTRAEKGQKVKKVNAVMQFIVTIEF